jgi:hypothetical protein
MTLIAFCITEKVETNDEENVLIIVGYKWTKTKNTVISKLCGYTQGLQ